MNANAYQTGQVKDLNREWLSDELTILEPEKTPFLSVINKSVDAKGTFHEVIADKLRAPRITGSREGDSGPKGGNKTTKKARFGSYLHRWFDSFGVTDVEEAVSKAGAVAGTNGSLYAENKLKAIRELKRDMESTLLSNQETQSGGTDDMRSRGAFKWLAASQTPAVPADYLTPTAQIVSSITALLESTLSGVLTSLSDQYGGAETFEMFAGNTYCEDINLFAVQETAAGSAQRYYVNSIVQGGDVKSVSYNVQLFSTGFGTIAVHNDKFVNVTSAGVGNGDAAVIINPEHWFLSMLEDLHAVDDESDAGGTSGYVKAIGGLFCKMPRGSAAIYGTLN